MITVTARINISENGGTISSVSGTNFVGDNASSELRSVLGRKNTNTASPFVLGGTRLGTGGKFVSKVPYFTSKQLSDKGRVFRKTYTITISGSNIEHAIIVFDKDNDGHPQRVLVDGVAYDDDDAQFELIFDKASDTHTVRIYNWNKPHSPLIITSIYADINIDIDRHNLISFDRQIIDRESIEYPSYGIISNSASITFSDKNQQVLDLIQQKILHSGLSVSLALNNTSSGVKEPLAFTQIRTLSYDNDNRQVNLTLKDNLENLQEFNTEPINYDFDNQGAKSFSALYDYLYKITVKNGFDMQSFEELDVETRFVLNHTTINYYLFEGGSLWDSWQKLCEALNLHIYVNENGKIICKY